MAFTAAVEWDVRTTGDDTNGGGFAVGSGGTDRSQSATAFQAYTDLVIDGTTNTDMTSAAHPFTSADVGNIVAITGGTGFTVQRVQILSIQGANTARVDRSLGTLGSTGGTGNLGGALASPALGTSLMVNGNTVHVKSATYSITNASTNVAGGCPSLTGSNTNPRILRGYMSSHRDTVTSPPLLQASGINTFVLITAASGSLVVNMAVDGASLSSSRGILGSGGIIYNCKASNCTNSGMAITVASSRAILCAATGCSTAAAFIATQTGVFFGCVAYGNSVAGFSQGATATTVFLYCLSANNSGASSDGFVGTSTSSPFYLVGCVAYGNGGAGFNVATGTTPPSVLINCLSTGNAGWQFTATGVTAFTFLSNCAAKADGSGTFDPTNLPNASLQFGNVTLTADPFTNAAGGDFSLNNVAGGGDACKRAGLLGAFPGASTINTTAYQDIGAVQHRQPGMIF